MDFSRRRAFWTAFSRGLFWSLVIAAVLCLALMLYEAVFVDLDHRNVILAVREVTGEQVVQTALAFVVMALYYAYLATRRGSD